MANDGGGKLAWLKKAFYAIEEAVYETTVAPGEYPSEQELQAELQLWRQQINQLVVHPCATQQQTAQLAQLYQDALSKLSPSKHHLRSQGIAEDAVKAYRTAIANTHQDGERRRNLGLNYRATADLGAIDQYLQMTNASTAALNAADQWKQTFDNLCQPIYDQLDLTQLQQMLQGRQALLDRIASEHDAYPQRLQRADDKVDSARTAVRDAGMEFDFADAFGQVLQAYEQRRGQAIVFEDLDEIEDLAEQVADAGKLALQAWQAFVKKRSEVQQALESAKLAEDPQRHQERYVSALDPAQQAVDLAQTLDGLAKALVIVQRLADESREIERLLRQEEEHLARAAKCDERLRIHASNLPNHAALLPAETKAQEWTKFAEPWSDQARQPLADWEHALDELDQFVAARHELQIALEAAQLDEDPQRHQARYESALRPAVQGLDDAKSINELGLAKQLIATLASETKEIVRLLRQEESHQKIADDLERRLQDHEAKVKNQTALAAARKLRQDWGGVAEPWADAARKVLDDWQQAVEDLDDFAALGQKIFQKLKQSAFKPPVELQTRYDQTFVPARTALANATNVLELKQADLLVDAFIQDVPTIQERVQRLTDFAEQARLLDNKLQELAFWMANQPELPTAQQAALAWTNALDKSDDAVIPILKNWAAENRALEQRYVQLTRQSEIVAEELTGIYDELSRIRDYDTDGWPGGDVTFVDYVRDATFVAQRDAQFNLDFSSRTWPAIRTALTNARLALIRHFVLDDPSDLTRCQGQQYELIGSHAHDDYYGRIDDGIAGALGDIDAYRVAMRRGIITGGGTGQDGVKFESQQAVWVVKISVPTAANLQDVDAMVSPYARPVQLPGRDGCVYLNFNRSYRRH